MRIDDAVGTATVEPGVTFRRLATRLARTTWMLSIPATTSAASVLGNALDRGIGSGIFADRFASVSELEVVLPNGDVVHTGFERLGLDVSARTLVPPAGPDVRGLFAQSSLGVVTRMTVGLQKMPASFALLAFDMDTKAEVALASKALTDLALAGAIRTSWTIWNEYRRYAQIMQMPWGALAPGQSLSSIAPTLRKRLRIAPWSGLLPIYGASEGHMRATLRLATNALAPHVRKVSRVPLGLDAMRGTPFLGFPDDANVGSAYFRKPGPRPSRVDLDADRCGVLWADVVVPVVPRVLEHLVGAWERIMTKAGFEPQVMITFPWARAAYVLALVLFDRDVPGEDARALACHERLLEAAARRGIGSARLATAAMGAVDEGTLLRAMTDALDPKRVSSPGRYARLTSPRRVPGAIRA